MAVGVVGAWAAPVAARAVAAWTSWYLRAHRTPVRNRCGGTFVGTSPSRLAGRVAAKANRWSPRRHHLPHRSTTPRWPNGGRRPSRARRSRVPARRSRHPAADVHLRRGTARSARGRTPCDSECRMVPHGDRHRRGCESRRIDPGRQDRHAREVHRVSGRGDGRVRDPHAGTVGAGEGVPELSDPPVHAVTTGSAMKVTRARRCTPQRYKPTSRVHTCGRDLPTVRA